MYTELKNAKNEKYDNDLFGQSLKFVDERCVGLRFDEGKAQEAQTHNFTGTSINENQIPYNNPIYTDDNLNSKKEE